MEKELTQEELEEVKNQELSEEELNTIAKDQVDLDLSKPVSH